MTFDELFQKYVDYGFTKPVTPISYGTGIQSLTTPMMTQPISNTSSITENKSADNMAPTTSTTGKGIGSLSISDIGKAIGFAMNPALGIASMAVESITGKSIAQQVMDAVNSMMGRGGDGGGGNPAASSDPDSQGDTGAATGGDGGGVGSSSDAGAGSTDSCGSFKDGGYVALGINPKDFK